MKALLKKIRQILQDRRTRRIFTRFVSTIAAIVVFVTTYALVLPAITMESEAACGIEAHQHSDECYEEELVCEIPESEDHQHEPECYKRILTCGKEIHVHSKACYESNTAEESAVAASTGSAGTASASASSDGGTTGATDSIAVSTGVASASSLLSEGNDISGKESEIEYGNENVGTGVTEADEVALIIEDNQDTDDKYVPTLKPLNFHAVLNDHTGIYYHHVEEGDTIEDSSTIPAADWNRIPDNADHEDPVELGKNDLLRVCLSYTIPAGSLNSTNPVARYRLPSNLHLTDVQVKAINENVNGIIGQYASYDTLEITDPEKYDLYLGVEAVEGNRHPDQTAEDYLAEHPEMNGSEYISAVVKVENVYNDHSVYLGQDLIFTFTPYSVQKNQHEYDKNGQPTKAGEKIEGWLTLDFNTDQVDWSEPEASENTLSAENAEKTETADIVFVNEEIDEQNNRIQGIHTELTLVEETRTDSIAEITETGEETEKTEETDESADSLEDTPDETDQNETADTAGADKSADKNADTAASDNTTEQATAAAANSDYSEGLSNEKAEKNDKENSEKNAGAKTGENTEEKENQKTSEYKDGTLEATGTGYNITLDYKADAQIPDNAYLKVSEITRESDEEAYEACLKEAENTIPAAGNTAVDEKASRFFDIEILADEIVSAQNAAAEITSDIDSTGAAEDAAEILENDSKTEETEQSNRSKDSSEPADTDTAEANTAQTDTADTDTADAESSNVSSSNAGSADADSSDTAASDADSVETVTRKIEPAAPVSVNIQLFDTEISENLDNYDVEQYKVVHFADEGTQEIQDVTAQEIKDAPKTSTQGKAEEETPAVAPATEIQFEAESFSIYGVVYTVDFHYEVNGKTYEFGIPGGGFVSLEHLIEILGIKETGEKAENSADEIDEGEDNASAGSTIYENAVKLNEVEVSEATRKFVTDVESVEFTSPELVWVGKVEEKATVGRLKEANSLEIEYSADLTEEQIDEINAQTVEAGDWALISMQPFTTEESLTVTMKNGNQFVVEVTDTQQKVYSNVNELDGREFALVSYYPSALLNTKKQETENADNERLQAEAAQANNLKWDSTVWKFEKAEGEGMFYISTYDAASNTTKYLDIRKSVHNLNRSDRDNVGDVRLVAEGSKKALKIVLYNDGTVCISGYDDNRNYKLDLWNYNIVDGFGAYAGNVNQPANHQRFYLVPIFTMPENTPFLIYRKAEGNSYNVIGLTDTVNCTNADEMNALSGAYRWTFRHVYDDKEGFYYEISNEKDPTYKIALTSDGQATVIQGGATVVVNAWNNGFDVNDGIQIHFKPNRYYYPIYLKNDGSTNSSFYGWQDYENNMSENTRLYLWTQERPDTVDLTVMVEGADDETQEEQQGTITCGSQQNKTVLVTQAVPGEEGTEKKYNESSITANPGGPVGTNNVHKYKFAYWDLDGKKLTTYIDEHGVEREYGATIAAGTLEIPDSDMVLTAHFERDNRYLADDDHKRGTPIRQAEIKDWLNQLKATQVPLDPNGCKKTAELYDYENRVYRVDLTAKSSLSTFKGYVDLGFIIDISPSMLFPSKLVPVEGLEDVEMARLNANSQGLQTSKVYFIIADDQGTATVDKIWYAGGKWRWVDASKVNTKAKINDFELKPTDEGSEIKQNNSNTFDETQFHKNDHGGYEKDASGKYTILKKYQVYQIAQDDKNTRAFYLEQSVDGTIDTMKQIMNILSIASTDANDPHIRIAWNTFMNQLGDGTGRRNRTFIDARTGNISIGYDYATGGTSTDAALLDAAGYRRDDMYQTNRFNSSKVNNINGRNAWKTTTDDYNSRWGTNGTPTYTDVIGGINSSATYRETGNDAYGFDWNYETGHQRYAVLITDGLPQRGGNPVDTRLVTQAADKLKNDRDVTLFTIGLGMSDIKAGRVLLYDLADKESKTGDPYFYEAKTGDELEYVLYNIVKTIIDDCYVQGTVTDTVGKAFYPVDKKTAKPLAAGNVINLDGEYIASNVSSLTQDQKNAGYGVLSLSGGEYTVKWTDQKFAPTGTGWQGSIYVKAKEDYLGGSTVRTNQGNTKIEATHYSVDDGATWIKLADSRDPAKVSVQIDDPNNPGQKITVDNEYVPKIENIPSPRVNVNELHFTSDNTKWTVYAGTNVNPKAQLMALYNQMEVIKVVTDEHPKFDHFPEASDDNSLMYEYKQSEADKSPTKEGYSADTFLLKDLIDRLAQEQNKPLNWETLIAMANSDDPNDNTGIDYRYDVYEPDYAESIEKAKRDFPGTINIKVVKEKGNINAHDASMDTSEEQYRLEVSFYPDRSHCPVEQKGAGDVEYHTGHFGLGQPGAATGDETGINSHIISVFRHVLKIHKTDDKGNTLNGAKFKVYTKEGNTEKIVWQGELTTGEKIIDPLTPDKETNPKPGTYWKDTTFYIEETESPGEQYQKYDGVTEVKLDMGDTVTNEGVYPYRWSQTASIQKPDNVEGYVTISDYEESVPSPNGDGSSYTQVVGVTITQINALGIDVNIFKTDIEGKNIPGARFKLTKDSALFKNYKAYKKGSSEEISLDDEGCFEVPAGGVTLKGLKTGNYILTEVSPPNGYLITLQPVKFNIQSSSDPDEALTYLNPSDNPEPKVMYTPSNFSYKLQNEPGAELPASGGSGTTLFYLLGMLLTGLAGAGLVISRKRKAA